MAIAIVALCAALLHLSRQVPSYQSRAEVLVQSVIPAPGQSNGVIVVMEDEQRVATSAEVADLVLMKLRSARVAVGQISVSGTTTNHALVFTAVAHDPVSAQRTAQAYATSYLEFRRQQVIDDFAAAREPIRKQLEPIAREIDEVQRQISAAPDESERAALISRFTFLLSQQSALQQSLNQLGNPVNLRIGSILQPALLPVSRSNPGRLRTLALAVFVGLCLGVGAAFLRDRLDQRVRGRHELQSLTDVPVLAIETRRRTRRTRKAHLAPLERGQKATVPPAAEAYTRLCRRILAAAAERQLVSLIVTSPGREARDSATMVNLGLALTEAGKSVVLVTAEPGPLQLPKHSMHRGGDNGDGRPREGYTPPVEPPAWMRNLWSLRQNLSAILLPDTPALLAPREMKEFIGQVQDLADFIVIDFPEILEWPDALALTTVVDAVLYVTDARQTTRDAAVDGVRQLRQAGAWVIGTVLTNASADEGASGPKPH